MREKESGRREETQTDRERERKGGTRKGTSSEREKQDRDGEEAAAHSVIIDNVEEEEISRHNRQTRRRPPLVCTQFTGETSSGKCATILFRKASLLLECILAAKWDWVAADHLPPSLTLHNVAAAAQ